MTKPRSKQPSVNFIDDPLAPEFFADSVSGAYMLNGNVRLTFEVGRVNHVTTPGPMNRVVCARLIMPYESLRTLRDFLNNFLGEEGLRRATRETVTQKLQ